MKKLMKKKVSLLGKEFSVFALVMVMMMTFTSAALVTYYATAVTGEVEIISPLTITMSDGTNGFDVSGQNAFEESMNDIVISSNVNTVIPTKLVMIVLAENTVFDGTAGNEFSTLTLTLGGNLLEQCGILGGIHTPFAAAVVTASCSISGYSNDVDCVAASGTWTPLGPEVDEDCSKSLLFTGDRTSGSALTYTSSVLNIPAKGNGNVDFVLTSQFKLNVKPDTFTFVLQPMTTTA